MNTILKHRLLTYILLGVGIICLLVAVYFSGRTIFFLTHRPPHFSRTSDLSLIQDWMSLPYISRMYRVPEKMLFDVVGADPQKNRRTSLKSLASKTGKNPVQLLQTVKQAILDFKQLPQTPPGGGQ